MLIVQVLCVITMPVALIIESHEDATFTFVSVSILLCNFLSMGLVFIPKVCAQIYLFCIIELYTKYRHAYRLHTHIRKDIKQKRTIKN